MIDLKRTFVSVLVSIVLVVTAVASTWMMASAGVFTGDEQALPSAPGGTTPSTLDAASQRNEALALSSDFQVSQPRDPFEPLILPGGGDGDGNGDTTTTTDADGSTTTTDGSGTTSATTTTTTAGGTTTTTIDDSPEGIRVSLLEVRDENGSLVAVVEVDDVTYTVGVGDTFATNFKVISLNETGGVFTYGDSAFTLAVGQSILK